MSLESMFEGQAIKSEMAVLILEKWGLHPTMEEKVRHAEPLRERDQPTSKWLIALNRSYRSLISGWVSDWSRVRLKSSTQYEAITLP